MERLPNDQEEVDSILVKTFLNLEEIDPTIFRSTHLYNPGRAVFGGQVVGQALSAASKTVPKGREANSLHCYFLRPGKLGNPILYQVLKTRDGITYSNRFVRATQLGKIIFTMMVSFKEPEEDEFSHQFTMPSVPDPDQLRGTRDLMRQRLLSQDVTEYERNYIEHILRQQSTMERRPVDPVGYYKKGVLPARQYVWVKAIGNIGSDQQMQKCVAAYLSDSILLSTATLPMARGKDDNGFFMTSLDHSIWFHRPIKADDWLLYEMESPQCGQGRGHTVGRIWRRDGTLVMSVSQEGVIRSSQPAASLKTEIKANDTPEKSTKSRL